MKSSSFRGALVSSGVIAFVGMGDALLYPLLPIYGKDMGFSIFFIGVLLSVNRFVRIIANTPISNMVYKFGMRNVLIVTSVFAVLTTFFYGLKLGMISFLIARVLWGLCYSGLKIATLNYTANTEKQISGLAFGLSTSIKTLGAFFILWFGPIIIDFFHIEHGLMIIALISSVGIFLAISLPKEKITQTNIKVKTSTTFYPSAINLLVFILSIAIDGILVVVLAHLLSDTYINTTELLVIVSFYLLLKRLFILALSLISGFISLRISPVTLFHTAILCCICAMLLISFNFVISGIIIAFIFNPIIITFAPLIAIEQQQDKNTLQAISSVSTWWDLGAAIGAFSGIYMIQLIGYSSLFFWLSVLIIILSINYFYQHAKTN